VSGMLAAIPWSVCIAVSIIVTSLFARLVNPHEHSGFIPVNIFIDNSNVNAVRRTPI
jgi:hypothetical protein